VNSQMATRVLKRSALADKWPRRDTTREWLVTNGLGGYASGTVDGVFTRRYHGLLIAALPFGRTMLLTGVSERIRLQDHRAVYLGVEELTGVDASQTEPVSEFRLEQGLPVWLWETADFAIEKRLLMSHRQNTVHIIYRLLRAAAPLRLSILPALHFRPHAAAVNTPVPAHVHIALDDDRCEVSCSDCSALLRMTVNAPAHSFTYQRRVIKGVDYATEQARGYESRGDMWSPGYYQSDLKQGETCCLVASTEPWEAILAIDSVSALEAERRRQSLLLKDVANLQDSDMTADLVLASDQFLMTPASRSEDTTQAHAEGEEAWSVIAGYPWFTDWGRDTMISLEGLTLCVKRYKEARWILRTFAHYVRDGLIPNMFPEGKNLGLYHTADATLWFFHALKRYLDATDDRETLRAIMPKLQEIVDCHIRGTRFGIQVDPSDGLLRQGEDGYQLTWMDAKMGDWVVTPRRGKAVEINGLWYNALRLFAQWLEEEEATKPQLIYDLIDQNYQSFNQRFWQPDRGYLLDLVDGEHGDDDALRPNQLLAISLDHPVLDEAHWGSVLNTVEANLLTPVGLRSLGPNHTEYKKIYDGDLRTRDGAYHQGTVWAWLIGPFIDVWLKVHPDERGQAARFLEGFRAHLDEACVGSISEVFDGDTPHLPRGCIAQAWSVAEVLRCLMNIQKVTGGPLHIGEERLVGVREHVEKQ